MHCLCSTSFRARVCVPALHLAWEIFCRGGLKLSFKYEGFQFSNHLYIFLNTTKRRKLQMGKTVADINTTAHTYRLSAEAKLKKKSSDLVKCIPSHYW